MQNNKLFQVQNKMSNFYRWEEIWEEARSGPEWARSALDSPNDSRMLETFNPQALDDAETRKTLSEHT